MFHLFHRSSLEEALPPQIIDLNDEELNLVTGGTDPLPRWRAWWSWAWWSWTWWSWTWWTWLG